MNNIESDFYNFIEHLTTEVYIIFLVILTIIIILIISVIETANNTRKMKQQNEELKKQLNNTNYQLNFICQYIGALTSKQNIMIPPQETQSQPTQTQKPKTASDMVDYVVNKFNSKK